jgi:glycosyltransferase involved in cell wall biosynthesis
MPFIALLLSKIWRVPVLVTFVGGDVPDKNDPNSILHWEEGTDVVPQSVLQADGLSSFSNYTTSLAEEAIGEMSDVSVIYGGINLPLMKIATAHYENNPYFFTARRLEYVKGIDLLISAFKKVAKRLPDHILLIAGEGPVREDLVKQAKELNIADKVRFLGEINQEKTFSYMKGAVAHICPSRAEGGGLVNYESQAAGCIAIGSDAGGIPEYIHDGITGLIFRNGDVEGLSNKLLASALDDAKMDQIKKGSLKESKKHSWDTFVDEYCRLYEKLIDRYTFNNLSPWSDLSYELFHYLSKYL